jgi:hypothetical protein
MVTSVATGVLNPDDTDGDGFLIFSRCDDDGDGWYKMKLRDPS